MSMTASFLIWWPTLLNVEDFKLYGIVLLFIFTYYMTCMKAQSFTPSLSQIRALLSFRVYSLKQVDHCSCMTHVGCTGQIAEGRGRGRSETCPWGSI